MQPLTSLQALNFFENNLPSFLSNKTTLLKSNVAELKKILEKESESMHSDSLYVGKKLINCIMSESINNLSQESKSPKDRAIENISEYVESFSKFEEYLFAMNPTYRDHTIHSLWVYLFGHQWIMRMGGYEKIKIASQVNIIYFKEGKPSFLIMSSTIKGQKNHLEAMWGMISILHDLGYPVEAITNEPNKVFGGILKPFAIDFNSIFQIDFSSPLTLLHQSICDLLSARYMPTQLTKEEVAKYYEEADKKGAEGHPLPIAIMREPAISKDEAMDAEFRIALANKSHAAWSTILAFKNINYLHESDYHGDGIRDYLKLLTRRDILYSILHHTTEEPKDEAVNRFQFILLLMDEIEEIGRYGKGGKERGIKSNYCELKWDIDEKKMLIEMDYEDDKEGLLAKYKEMSNKYRTQISYKNENSRYRVEIRFIGKDLGKSINLTLVKDN